MSVASADRVALLVLSRAAGRGWRDFDPYDGLAGWGQHLPDRPAILKRLLTQAAMRTPTTMRRLLAVEPHVEPYTLGILLSTSAVLGDTFAEALRSDLASRILNLRLSPSGGWGYCFPVVTRAARYGPDEPNVISTVFAGMGLLDWIQFGAESAEAKLALDEATAWLRRTVWDPDERVFHYHEGNRKVIHNASVLAALLLARMREHSGLESNEITRDAVARVVEAQRPDGSWPYGEGVDLEWVDNHHTAFILKALLLLPDSDRPEAWEGTVQSGLDFYTRNLIAADGWPIASTSNRFPADSLSAGQAIETLALSAELLLDEKLAHLANRVFEWTESNLRRKDGRYAFRIGPYMRWPGAYLRWGEAHIALGAARLSKLTCGSR